MHCLTSLNNAEYSRGQLWDMITYQLPINTMLIFLMMCKTFVGGGRLSHLEKAGSTVELCSSTSPVASTPSGFCFILQDGGPNIQGTDIETVYLISSLVFTLIIKWTGLTTLMARYNKGQKPNSNTDQIY